MVYHKTVQSDWMNGFLIQLFTSAITGKYLQSSCLGKALMLLLSCESRFSSLSDSKTGKAETSPVLTLFSNSIFVSIAFDLSWMSKELRRVPQVPKFTSFRGQNILYTESIYPPNSQIVRAVKRILDMVLDNCNSERLLRKQISANIGRWQSSKWDNCTVSICQKCLTS